MYNYEKFLNALKNIILFTFLRLDKNCRSYKDLCVNNYEKNTFRDIDV